MPKTNCVITAADEDAIKRLPDGDWFGLESVTYMVRRPYWRCERLVKMGLLEGRLTGTFPDTKTQYRKPKTIC